MPRKLAEVMGERVVIEDGARWHYRKWDDGCEQWFLPGAQTFVEKYHGRGGWFVVARPFDNKHVQTSVRAPVISGPYKMLPQAKRVYLVSHMVAGEEVAFMT